MFNSISNSVYKITIVLTSLLKVNYIVAYCSSEEVNTEQIAEVGVATIVKFLLVLYHTRLITYLTQEHSPLQQDQTQSNILTKQKLLKTFDETHLDFPENTTSGANN